MKRKDIIDSMEKFITQNIDGNVRGIVEEDWNEVIKEVYEEFSDENKYKLPVLIGKEVETGKPYIFDFDKNPNMLVHGHAGSGKSWGILNVLYNLTVTNHPNDVKFIMMNSSDDFLYSKFSELPHVLKYSTDILSYLDMLKELQDEIARRRQLLNSFSVTKWSELKELSKDNTELPYLFVFIDDIYRILYTLEDCKGIKIKDEFIDTLHIILKECRICGIRLILCTQIIKFTPRLPIEQCSIRLGYMTDCGELERTHLLDNTFKGFDKAGEALIATKESKDRPVHIKTLNIGIKNDRFFVDIINELVNEWKLRLED